MYEDMQYICVYILNSDDITSNAISSIYILRVVKLFSLQMTVCPIDESMHSSTENDEEFGLHNLTFAYSQR